MNLMTLMFIAWVYCGYCLIEGRIHWKKEYNQAKKTNDPEEIADSLAFKDFFLLPFVVLSIVLIMPGIKFLSTLI